MIPFTCKSGKLIYREKIRMVVFSRGGGMGIGWKWAHGTFWALYIFSKANDLYTELCISLYVNWIEGLCTDIDLWVASSLFPRAKVVLMWGCLRTASAPSLLLPYFRPPIFSLALHSSVTCLQLKRPCYPRCGQQTKSTASPRAVLRNAGSWAPPGPALRFNQLLREP